jgi:MSHA pilin protein MshD
VSATRGQLATGYWQAGQNRIRRSSDLASSQFASGQLTGMPVAIATRMRGVTLIELVISIVVIAVSVSAVMGVLTMLSTGSAEAMVRNQAVAIATAYLEEVRLKDFAANGVPGSRSLYDDMSDYNGLTDVGARDQLGNAIAGLEQYTVTVSVGAGTLGSVPGASVRRIDVNVQHPAGVNMTVSGYRTAL